MYNFSSFITRTGKIKGIERLLGAVETLEHSLMEVSSGSAKYEHQHRAIVWRIARLPKEGQGKSNKSFSLISWERQVLFVICILNPRQLLKYIYVHSKFI